MTDDGTLFHAPRLTRLEIQGFKSFLSRTVFAFEPGITAVVGPNGSGKSNVADAVRWVLGEQGQHALRAKKTEDVIFSGGQGRPPAGMAEATLTFDNSEGWLPIDFSEVTVTRRAFRTGENQYLINGRKVRLKDVAQLTAGLGQSHVVVGQGLVDAALSLRAEERRGLFEHAADLAGLRLKVADAERNLAETDANTARLNDLLIELEPRLEALERAARQSQEWHGIRVRLRELQGAHYRAALEAAHAAHGETRSAAEHADAAVATAREEVERLTVAHERATTRLAAVRERLAAHDESRAALEDSQRRLTHERDLAAARIEALGKRRGDMDDAREGLDERVAAVAADLAKLVTDLRELERATAEARGAVARHSQEAAARRTAQAEIEARLDAAKQAFVAAERQEADQERQRAVLAERDHALGAERDRVQSAGIERLERITALEVELAAAASAAAADETHIAACDARLAELAGATDTTARDATGARAELERVQKMLGEAATRLEVLRRLQESGAGLHGGPREVLAAGRDGRLNGILGAVAELLEAPKALEIAIEAALGARLQDIVVATWTDAEAAIAHLKQSGAGRATFQPLDTIRAGRDGGPAQDAKQQAGVLGVAADLITTSPSVAPVAAALLGRTLVVEDLTTVRGVLGHLSSGWSVVTISGEIARVGGAVTGGSAVRESGALARERELRELPGAVSSLETQLTEARGQVTAADAAARAAVDAQRAAAEERARRQAAATVRQQQHERLASWLADLQSEQAGSERRVATLEADQHRIAAELHELDLEKSRLAAARHHAARDRDGAEEVRTALTAEASQRERAAAEDGRRLAGLEERLRGERRREAGLRAQERALSAELALRAERTATLDRERAALAADHARMCDEVTATTGELAVASDAREPLRMEAMGAEIAAGRLAESLQAARSHLVERDRERDHAGFALERAVQEQDAVRRRIRDDLEIENPDEVLAWSPSSVASAPEAREAEIARLRERLRRVGYAGEDAVADYEREAAHQAFLREQLADVEGAAAALRDLLADLRQTMRARFDETFARVTEAFADAFTTLFGGGTAKLVLITGDNGAEPGIDIIAQPPGKRLQSLALLSGGERALTAAALLFAILRVNPVPFCLLDEVDAALDEANVVRFREQLQALAARTQVIVVTHNRGTIEIADTLYGVSMAADGVSQVLSLRLTESLPAD
jgi:chromosome segregation protein